MKRALLYLATLLLFPLTGNAQVSYEDAKCIFYNYAVSEVRMPDYFSLFTKDQVFEDDGSTVIKTSVAHNHNPTEYINFKLNYPCWSFLVNEWRDINCICYGFYVFVSQSNGNILSIRTSSDTWVDVPNTWWSGKAFWENFSALDCFPTAEARSVKMQDEALPVDCSQARSTISARASVESAEATVLGYIGDNIRGSFRLYTNDYAPDNDKDVTIDTGASIGDGENINFSLNFPCWAYYIDSSPETDAPDTGLYLFVHKVSGYLLRVNTTNDTGPSDLSQWQLVCDSTNVQVLQKEADEMVRQSVKIPYRLYANDKAPDAEGFTTINANINTTDSNKESFTLSYPCWSFYVKELRWLNEESDPKYYFFVDKNKGNLLTIRTRNDFGPVNFEEWRYAEGENEGEKTVLSTFPELTANAQISRAEANKVIREYIDSGYVKSPHKIYFNDNIQDADGTTTINTRVNLDNGNLVNFKLNYPCWPYIIDEYPDASEPHPLLYLFVNKSTRNLLEARTEGDLFPAEDTNWQPTDLLISAEKAKSEQQSLSPNPVNDVLEIKAEAGFTGIDIYDSVGKQVYSRSFESERNVYTLNLSFLESGAYYITIRNANGEKNTHKIIKR